VTGERPVEQCTEAELGLLMAQTNHAKAAA
jgi:hypothetical protein